MDNTNKNSYLIPISYVDCFLVGKKKRKLKSSSLFFYSTSLSSKASRLDFKSSYPLTLFFFPSTSIVN